LLSRSHDIKVAGDAYNCASANAFRGFVVDDGTGKRTSVLWYENRPAKLKAEGSVKDFAYHDDGTLCVFPRVLHRKVDDKTFLA